jgi:hypothetical protein
MECWICGGTHREDSVAGQSIVNTGSCSFCWVELLQDGVVKYGVVKKGGTKVQVVLDGGEVSMSGPARAFITSVEPLAVDGEDEMSKYTVVKYKALRGEETPRFECEISLHGGQSLGSGPIFASNDGNGGCNTYRIADRRMQQVLDAFHADAKAWAARYGDPDMIEAADLWLDWYVNMRPYGVTAKVHVAKHAAEMAVHREEGRRLRQRHGQAEAARLAGLGPLHVGDDEDARVPQLPERFVWTDSILKDTVTGRSVDVPLFAARSVARVLAVLFGDLKPRAS